MDNIADIDAKLKSEMAAVVIFLGLGAARLVAKSETHFELKRKGTEPFPVSIKALAVLAKKNWVVKDGTRLRITDRALEACEKQTGVDQRAIETVEVCLESEIYKVSRVAVESPIDYLAIRKDKNGVALISKSEWNAGDRLRSDFTRANMLPGIGMRWGEPIRVSGGAGGGVNQTDTAMAARARVNKAMNAVGPEFSGLLLDVCCFLKGLEQVEMERGWPQRSAKLMVRTALSILARHYNPPAQLEPKLRSWGSEDYRPTL